VCAREAECLRETASEQPWDTGECAEHCGQLEREPALQAQVEAHVRCVTAAPACPQVLECP
jgi:hypothetical protein